MTEAARLLCMSDVVVNELVCVMQFEDDTVHASGPKMDFSMQLQPWCCVIDCPQPAVVRIYDTRPETPYDCASTDACADHVRELDGEQPWAIVERLGVPPVVEIVNTAVQVS